MVCSGVTYHVKWSRWNDYLTHFGFPISMYTCLKFFCCTYIDIKSLSWFTCLIISILRSLVILAIWLALTHVFCSQIAPFYTLNGIFLPANETALLKNSNQSNFKAFWKKSIKLQENERQLCNFLQTSSVYWINKNTSTDLKNLYQTLTP